MKIGAKGGKAKKRAASNGETATTGLVDKKPKVDMMSEVRYHKELFMDR